MWRGLDTSEFEEMESSPGECVIFVVRVWNCRVKDKHKLIFQSIMDLNRLGYVGTNVRHSPSCVCEHSSIGLTMCRRCAGGRAGFVPDQFACI